MSRPKKQEGFDLAQACRILGIKADQPRSDPQMITLEDVPLAAVQKLVAADLANVKDCQNNSPTLGELLEVVEALSALNAHTKFLMMGYIICPPREDARVTFDGVKVQDASVRVTASLINKWHGADAVSISPDGDEASFWWD